MLSGSLDAFALPDVISLLAGRKVTGRVEIVREEISGEIWVDRGRVVASRLTDEEPPTNVDEAIDVAVVLFDGTAGSFSVKAEEWVGGPLDFDADGLVAAVDKRRQEWADVISRLGSLEDPLVLAPELPEGVDQVVITPDRWKLLTLINGSRSVQDISRDAATTVYATALAMADLAAAGLVVRGGGVKWEGFGVAKEDDPIEVLRELGDTSTPTPDEDLDAAAEAAIVVAVEVGDAEPSHQSENSARERRLLRRK